MLEEHQFSEQKSLKRLARNCIVFSLAAHLLCAWFINWIYHPDQLFQILEFGGYKLGIIPAKDLAWEFSARLRPAIQPAAVYFIAKISGTSFNPVLTTLLLRFIAAIIGWISLTFLTLIALNWVKDYQAKRFLLYCYACLWFLPYLHANFSSESLSGSLFFAGAGCAWMAKNRDNKNWLPGCGLLIGLAFVCRYQTGFMIAGLISWCIFIQKFSFKKIVYIFIPAALTVLLGVLLDRWFYGEWVNTAWNYLKVNLVDGKANSFGVFPWWQYFVWSFYNLVLPFSIIIIAGTMYAITRFPKNIIVISVIPYIFIHLIISHKEPRFMFPLVDAVPVLLALSYAQLKTVFDKKRNLTLWLQNIFVIANLAMIGVVVFKPQTDPYDLYEVIHDKYWDSKAVMYCSNDQPYSFIGMVTQFYKPSDFNFYTSLNKGNIDSIMSHTKTGHRPVLVFFDREKDELSFTSRHPEAKLIYTAIPTWMYYLNINNWISRTIKLSLYQMPDKNSKVSHI